MKKFPSSRYFLFKFRSCTSEMLTIFCNINGKDAKSLKPMELFASGLSQAGPLDEQCRSRHGEKQEYTRTLKDCSLRELV